MADLLSVAECEDIVRNCLKSQVRILSSEVVRLPNENFVLKVTIHDGFKERTLSFFAKTSLKKPKIHKIIFDDFKNTIPKFDPKITPKLYYGKSNLLFFEDLTWQGFRVCSKQDLDLDHVKIVLNVLAKLHSGSLAFEEIKKEETGESFTLDNKYKLDLARINLKKTEVVDLLSALTKRDDLAKLLEELEERQHSRKSRRTLCHGNLMIQNIMFKYDGEIPTDCKLIKFEAKQYVSPICDILQLLFFTTSEDFRQHHTEDLLFYYHTRLCEELKRCFLKPEDILTYEQLRTDAHHFLPIIKLERALHSKNDESLAALEEIFTCPILSREDCYTIIKNKTGTSNYKLLSFVVTPLDQVNGYLGTYHRLTLKIFHEFEETINCFIKTMPKNTSSRSVVQESGCFFKEVFIYQTLVPQMQKLSIETIHDCLPSCFFQRCEELIVFDDLNVKNYRMLPIQLPFDLSLLSLTVKKLAKFHASTVVFEEQMSEELDRKYRLLEEYEKYLQESFFSEDKHSGALLMQVGLRTIPDVINLFPELKTEENQLSFYKFWPKLQTQFFNLIKPSTLHRNVLSHGDLWTNNIMVKFEGTEPIDCVFVDYQCIRYCPPAHDFLCVIYLTTNRATRMKNEEEIKRIYHEEFAKVLQTYGYEARKIFSYEEFLESVETVRPQIVMQAIIYKMFMCSSEEISSLLVNDEISNYVFFQTRKEYVKNICEKSTVVKNNLRECILDLYSLCNSVSNI